MKLPQLIKKLEGSEVFQDFKSKNPDTFLCAGFFILNFKNNTFEYNLDYRNDKEIFTFKIPIAPVVGEAIMMRENILESQKPLEKLNSEIDVEIDEIQKIVEEQLSKNKVKNRLEEIIAVLQSKDGKIIWHLTCMCESFAIIAIQINAVTKDIISFEKKNLFDFIKK